MCLQIRPTANAQSFLLYFEKPISFFLSPLYLIAILKISLPSAPFGSTTSTESSGRKVVMFSVAKSSISLSTVPSLLNMGFLICPIRALLSWTCWRSRSACSCSVPLKITIKNLEIKLELIFFKKKYLWLNYMMPFDYVPGLIQGSKLVPSLLHQDF